MAAEKHSLVSSRPAKVKVSWPRANDEACLLPYPRRVVKRLLALFNVLVEGGRDPFVWVYIQVRLFKEARKTTALIVPRILLARFR